MTALDSARSDLVERLLGRDPADRERILPIDERQRELTERYIVPVLPQLEEEFLDIREVVDLKLRHDLPAAQAAGWVSRNADPYPKGFCLPITLHAFAEFEARTATRPSAATRAVQAFRRAGGHVAQVWGVLRNQYFQNALQFGSLYFDVANDTVVVTKPKIEYMPMAESGFRNIASWEEFADVAERYWKCEMYPNLHFPRLAPLLPMLKLSEEGVLSMESPAYYMQRMNLESGFRASETFVTSGSWSAKRLPDVWLDRIASYKAERLPIHAQTPRIGVDLADVARLCAEYRTSDAYSTRPFLIRVFKSAMTIAIHRTDGDADRVLDA